EIKLNPLIKLNFCSASTSAKAAFYSTQIPCQPGAEGFFENPCLPRMRIGVSIPSGIIVCSFASEFPHAQT
ncbi:MAG: hypothetical protein WBI41_11590, partial [Azovibrio sp.]